MCIRQKMNRFLLQFEAQKRVVSWVFSFRERVCDLTLDFQRSDHRFASSQEVKLFYTTRATRGHRFGGVPTTPRGRGLLLLVLFFV